MVQRSILYDMAVEVGAVFTERDGWECPEDSGDPQDEYRAAVERVALFDLSPRGKVELRGPEAASFLHNLCSNDIKKMKDKDGCEAFLTTAKARVVAHFFVSHWLQDGQEVFFLDTVPDQAERICDHLNHFLISEQLEIADRTDHFAHLHLCGPDAALAVESVTGQPVPELPPLHHVVQSDGGTAVYVRRNDFLGLPGYDLFCKADTAAPVWNDLAKHHAEPAGTQTYETLRVEAGFPEFGKDMDEERLVMEVGRTAQAVCYTKGCFLGQEPIVMARDRGHVNRTLLGLRLTGNEPVHRGAKVFVDGEDAGVITSSAFSPRAGTALALAYLKRGEQTPGLTVEIEHPDGPRHGTVAALPMVTR